MKNSNLKSQWDECKVMSELDFTYLEKQQPVDYAAFISHALGVYPSQYTLTGSYK
jgi:hypothetical protein